MNPADLTVAIATYNGEGFITKALDSALATGCRVVVSDDNSTDDTRTLLEAYGSTATVLYQTRNIGIAAQYQLLLEACTTPLALLLNQDDTLIPEAVMALPIDPREVTVLNGWVIDENDKRLRPIYRRPPAHVTVKGVFAGLLVENFIRSPSQVIFPTNNAREVGGFLLDGGLGQGAEDHMCWLRMASAGLRFKLRLRPSMEYRVHGGNYSHNTESSESYGTSRSWVRAHVPATPSRDRRLALRW